MSTRSPRRPALRRKFPIRQPGGNPVLNRQTRKLLTQHYRAKYGVR